MKNAMVFESDLIAFSYWNIFIRLQYLSDTHHWVILNFLVHAKLLFLA